MDSIFFFSFLFLYDGTKGIGEEIALLFTNQNIVITF